MQGVHKRPGFCEGFCKGTLLHHIRKYLLLVINLGLNWMKGSLDTVSLLLILIHSFISYMTESIRILLDLYLYTYWIVFNDYVSHNYEQKTVRRSLWSTNITSRLKLYTNF